MTEILLCRLQRPFQSGDHLALHGKRLAGNTCSRRRRMPAAAKLLRDFIHIDLLVLGTQADACQFGFEFFKDARNNDRFNRADMVNEPLGIVALGAGAGEIGLLQPQIGDLVVLRETEFAVNMFQQFGAGQRITLLNFVADFREVCTARDEFRANV